MQVEQANKLQIRTNGLAGLDILSKTKQIVVKRKKIAKLYKELDLSISIETIWPDAFKHGVVKSSIQANMYKLDKAKVTFRNDKEEKTFLLSELPTPLKHQKLHQMYNQAIDRQKGPMAEQINKFLGLKMRSQREVLDFLEE